MATTVNVTTTYAGEFAGRFIGSALLSANTIAQGGITVKQNIKYKEVVKKMVLGDLTADASCDFTPISSLDLTERVLEPKRLQVNLELCKDEFVQDWEAIQMGFSAHDNLPPNLTEFLISRVLAKVAAATEIDLWRGTTASGHFEGLVPLMTADADVVDVVGTTVTATNVIEELGKVVDAILPTLYGKEDLYIYVSQNIARAYIRALGGFGAAGLGANGIQGNGTMWYNGANLAIDGVKIFVANGLADNIMVAAEKENLWFGTGLLNDYNLVKVLDMADLDGSQNVRFVMRYTAGVQYGIGGDIVLYS